MKWNMETSPTFKRHINPRFIQTSLNPVDYVGEGSYGRVRKIYTKKIGVSAAKIFHVTGTVERQKEMYKIVEHEADMLSLINHENIVRFHGVTCWSHNFALIMDYEVMGNLHMLLKNVLVLDLPWKFRLRVVQETVKAISYLHNSGLDDRMVHGDLKSCNILLSKDLRVRVADFGASTIATKTCEQTSHVPPPNARVHTVVFSAPEFLQNVFTSRTKAMDVFSFGRVIYEIMTRRIPFEGHFYANITDAIICNVKPDVSMLPKIKQDLVNTSDEDLKIVVNLEALMEKCCMHNPLERPDIFAVMELVEETMKCISLVTLAKSVLVVLTQMDVDRRNSSPESRVYLNTT